MDIMFKITKEEHYEIVAIISKCCCLKPAPAPYSYCSEIDCCDVQVIYRILRSHLKKNYVKPDEEDVVIEWSREEVSINIDDKIPLKK